MKPLPALALLGTLAVAGCVRHTPTTAPGSAPPPPTQTPIVPTPNPTAGPTPNRQCSSVDGLPDPVCTPGAVRTTDLAIICKGGTKQFRPPVTYTENLKTQGIVEYGYTDTSLSDYEEDHLISLELGGDGYDPRNLWPEPHLGNFNSFQKDQVENWLHKQICSGAIPVADAQRGIAQNWKQYLSAAAAAEPLRAHEIE